MSRPTLGLLSVSFILLSGLLVACGDSNEVDGATPTDLATQGYDNPPTVEESQELAQGDSWAIGQPGAPDSVTHPVNDATLSLPDYMSDLSVEAGAPENIWIFAKELEGDAASNPTAPVENLYVGIVPLTERFANTDQTELSDPLELLAYALVSESKSAFAGASDFASGPVVNTSDEPIGQYVTFMSSGERLTRIEIVRDDTVLMLSSTITGAVEPPDYLTTLMLP